MTTGGSKAEEHPVLVREIAGAEGPPRLALRVFCSRRAASVPLETCEACAFCTEIAPDTDSVSAVVRCAPPGREGHRAMTPVGTVLRGTTLCVGRDAGVSLLLGILVERELPELFVVDEEGRLAGLIRDFRLPRLLQPAPGAGPRPLHGPEARVDAVMSSTPSIEESASVTYALRRIANAHLRAIPVVTREGQLVGVLRDIDGLRWLAAHRRGER